jgi:hypothetical protein
MLIRVLVVESGFISFERHERCTGTATKVFASAKLGHLLEHFLLRRRLDKSYSLEMVFLAQYSLLVGSLLFLILIAKHWAKKSGGGTLSLCSGGSGGVGTVASQMIDKKEVGFFICLRLAAADSSSSEHTVALLYQQIAVLDDFVLFAVFL